LLLPSKVFQLLIWFFIRFDDDALLGGRATDVLTHL